MSIVDRSDYKSMTLEMLEREIGRLYDDRTVMDSTERGDRLNFCRAEWCLRKKAV